MDGVLTSIRAMLPVAATLGVAVAVLVVADRLILPRTGELGSETKLSRQLLLLALTGIAVVCVVLALPVAESTRNQLLTLLGLAITALIALSSTTFVANAMAGIMLRSVKNFRPGDFVRVGEHFGRVTERGLFHTEVQTEDSDLTTLPNLLLISNPVTVIRSHGTIVSATVSLGYDKSHSELEPILCEAAAAVDLKEPFVQVIDLADHAVSYRVAGFLTDVKLFITVRSSLRKSILDALHAARVEVVSPSFMIQRRLQSDEMVLAQAPPSVGTGHAVPRKGPEDIVFDKAEAAERVEEFKRTGEQLAGEIRELEEQLKNAAKAERIPIETRLVERKAQLAAIQDKLERIEAEASA
jgi:small-conductance mechanosensitive channel